MTANASSATLFSGTDKRAVNIALVDLRFRHEAVYVDGVAALDCDCVELFVFYLQVDALIDFVATTFSSGSTGSPVPSSTSCWRRRLPVSC